MPPRIVYNGINLDFPEELEDWANPWVFRGGSNTSDGGVTERVRSGTWQEITISLLNFPQRTFYDQLFAWWGGWASKGGQYSFAYDLTKTVNTTTVNAEIAGATVIEVASTTGIVALERYLMRASDLSAYEIVTVQSISIGVSVTLSSGTKFAYPAGSIFRDIDFFPKLTTIDDDQPFKEEAGLTYSLVHRAREDRA